jgi:hypothetical protein
LIARMYIRDSIAAPREHQQPRIACPIPVVMARVEQGPFTGVVELRSVTVIDILPRQSNAGPPIELEIARFANTELTRRGISIYHFMATSGC